MRAFREGVSTGTTEHRRADLFAAYEWLIPKTVDSDTLDYFAEEIEENDDLARSEKDELLDMIEAQQVRLAKGYHSRVG